MVSLLFLSLLSWSADDRVTIGSKAFTEGYILAEIAAQSIANIPDAKVSKRFGIGGTGLVVEALESGKIDVYPEYTGTIVQAVLKNPALKSFDEIQAALKERGLQMTAPLGFDNTYAIGLSPKAAGRFPITKLSELTKYPQLRLGLSSEYFSRPDGFPTLVKILGLRPATTPVVMSHELAYGAIEADTIDAMDVYSTDANIEKVGLHVLEDDVHAAPNYQAVFLASTEFVERCPECWKRLEAWAGKISEYEMRRMNVEATVQNKDFITVASQFLEHKGQAGSAKRSPILLSRIKEHMVLVSIAFLFSLAVGIPLGFLGFHYRVLGQLILGTSGLIQTVPSLALFCLLIPFFGIGQFSAIVALCLYALLPVVSNTVVGLQNVDPQLFEVSDALCLSRRQRLWRMELPLASRSIWSGLKTSTIITIGTATLAALIGAGGLGAPIVEGLALNNMNLVLLGAVPSALLALFTHFLFDYLERWVIPQGLK
jgi:osmoprotectant transport system permease protein